MDKKNAAPDDPDYYMSEVFLMAKIEVNPAKCKGCGLCIEVCPLKLLEMSKAFNSFGNYYPVQTQAEKCIGCALCGVMCPDLCISVYKD